MIYLTARGIGMATTTKEYLKSIRQGGANLALPDAPVLLSPTRLIESLTREVIRRNPEEFKIECLNKIRSLWPQVHSLK
jgi:phosphatidate phosphatase LPIN